MTTCDPIVIPDPPPEIPAGISTDVVTEGCVDGKGIYDVFMQAHLDSIHQEYAKQRIKGSEYSQVYLGGMQAAMAQAVGFALGKDRASAEAEAARYAADKAFIENELLKAQLCKVQKEIELTEAQRQLIAAQTWAEIAKTDHNIATRMAELLVGTYDGPAAVTEESVLGAQIQKVIQEESLLLQKEQTEKAQVADEVNSGPVKGVILKEKNLTQRQSDGFIRDAEAKVAKLAADAFNVQYSTVDGDIGETSGWDLDDLWEMLETARDNTDKAEDADDDINNTP